jgi:hypothetical protein
MSAAAHTAIASTALTARAFFGLAGAEVVESEEDVSDTPSYRMIERYPLGINPFI